MLESRIADHVHHQSYQHGGVVLLDRVAGEWLALNQTAGEFWRRWDSGMPFEDSVDTVAARFPGARRESIRADAERLASDLVARGLITVTRPAGVAMAEARPADRPRPRVNVPRRVLAYCCLVAADVLLRCSFRASFRLVRALHRRWSRTAPASAWAQRAVAAVAEAGRAYPGRAACLEQSLAAVLLAALSRRRLDWCLGSATDPYRFHAWTETDGRPVSDEPAGFARMLSVLPAGTKI